MAKGSKNTKKKVQAQRKFAQGAFKPPSCSNNNRPGRNRVALRNANNIAYVTTQTAPEVLDFVSFKSLRILLQPNRVMERMLETSTMTATVIETETGTEFLFPAAFGMAPATASKSATMITTATATLTKTRTSTVTNMTATSKDIITFTEPVASTSTSVADDPTFVVPRGTLPSNQRTYDLRLRSRVVGGVQPRNKRVFPKPNSSRKRPLNASGNSQQGPSKRRQSRTSDFSVEDYEPLAYFTNAQAAHVSSTCTQSNAPELLPLKRVTRQPARLSSCEYVLTRLRSKSIPRRNVAQAKDYDSGPPGSLLDDLRASGTTQTNSMPPPMHVDAASASPPSLAEEEIHFPCDINGGIPVSNNTQTPNIVKRSRSLDLPRKILDFGEMIISSEGEEVPICKVTLKTETLLDDVPPLPPPPAPANTTTVVSRHTSEGSTDCNYHGDPENLRLKIARTAKLNNTMPTIADNARQTSFENAKLTNQEIVNLTESSNNSITKDDESLMDVTESSQNVVPTNGDLGVTESPNNATERVDELLMNVTESLINRVQEKRQSDMNVTETFINYLQRNDALVTNVSESTANVIQIINQFPLNVTESTTNGVPTINEFPLNVTVSTTTAAPIINEFPLNVIESTTTAATPGDDFVFRLPKPLASTKPIFTNFIVPSKVSPRRDSYCPFVLEESSESGNVSPRSSLSTQIDEHDTNQYYGNNRIQNWLRDGSNQENSSLSHQDSSNSFNLASNVEVFDCNPTPSQLDLQSPVVIIDDCDTTDQINHPPSDEARVNNQPTGSNTHTIVNDSGSPTRKEGCLTNDTTTNLHVFIIEDDPPPEMPNCPLKRYRTLKELCQVKEELVNFCECGSCKIIKTVYTLIRLLDSSSKALKNKVYDFDDSQSTASRAPQLRLGDTRRRRISRSRVYSDQRKGKPVYLDVLPHGNPHMVEMKVTNVTNQVNHIVSSRLVSKSRNKNFPLILRGDLLEEVIQSLGFKLDQPGDGIEVIEKWDVSVLTYAQAYTGERMTGDTSVLNNLKPSFPKRLDTAMLVDAPIYHPTAEEFTDPIAYFEKIMPSASKYGLCKVVPPEGFNPSCSMDKITKFTVANQYITRLYNRWSPVTREMCAIKSYSASQKVVFSKAPLLEGMELNLPKLYHLVQRHGGLQTVIRKKRWARIAEELRCPKITNPGHKLDVIYVKYLLPYDTLSHQERQRIICRVEKAWQRKNQRMLERAINPLHRQKRLLGESDSSEDETEEPMPSLVDAEDCIIKGRNMVLPSFKKVATTAMEKYFPRTSTTTADIEEEYWRLVLLNTDHVCVNAASIDTGIDGHGFTIDKTDPYSEHPWNLKVLSRNSGNVLRSMGRMLGVTVPTLHLGMVFSTSCWHRDPHGLPWIEYIHAGAGKIWYGIPNEQSNNFRKAVENLCPTSCQNKTIWLPSDIAMIPPNLLLESDVSMSRIEQRPGEFIIVFPKAYSSSVSTGQNYSESVYFATKTWLNGIQEVFQEARDSCEPTTFAQEQLLISIALDPRAQISVLQQVHSNLNTLLTQELFYRRSLEKMQIVPEIVDPLNPTDTTSRPKGPQKKPTVSTKKTAVSSSKPKTPAKKPKLSAKKPKEPASKAKIKEDSTGTVIVRDSAMCGECDICRTNLYLSKVVGVLDEPSALCVQHAVTILEKNDLIKPEEITLYVYYSNRELRQIIDNLQKRITAPRGPQPGPSTAQ